MASSTLQVELDKVRSRVTSVISYLVIQTFIRRRVAYWFVYLHSVRQSLDLARIQVPNIRSQRICPH